MSLKLLSSNKRDALKSYFRRTYAGWKSLDDVLRQSHVSAAQNEFVEKMVLSTLGMLLEANGIDNHELAHCLDALLVMELEREIPMESIQTVANTVFAHFRRFVGVDMQSQKIKATASRNARAAGPSAPASLVKIDLGQRSKARARAALPPATPVAVPNPVPGPTSNNFSDSEISDDDENYEDDIVVLDMNVDKVIQDHLPTTEK